MSQKGTMKKTYCYKSGKEEWANQSGKKGKEYLFRCTKCGEAHGGL